MLHIIVLYYQELPFTFEDRGGWTKVLQKLYQSKENDVEMTATILYSTSGNEWNHVSDLPC